MQYGFNKIQMIDLETVRKQIIHKLYYKALDNEISPGFFLAIKEELYDIFEELKEYYNEKR